MHKWRRLFLTIAVLGIAAFAVIYFLQGLPSPVAKALREADTFELLSLDPEHNRPDADFHGYKVLGRTLIMDPTTRRQLYDALQSGVRTMLPAKCFDPRHAIRVTSKQSITDLLICFECFQVKVYSGEKLEQGFSIDRTPAPVFDQVLSGAGVPLAPK